MEHHSPTFIGANGFPVAARYLLLEVVASNNSELDFTGLDGTFPRYVIEGNNVAPNSNSVQLNAQFSIEGAFMSGVADYGWVVKVSSSSGFDDQDEDSSDAHISTSRSSGNDRWSSGAFQTGDITFTITKGGLGNHPRLWSVSAHYSSGGDFVHSNGMGAYKGTTSSPSGIPAEGIDGVRLSFSAGLIQQGTFRFYGVE